MTIVVSVQCSEGIVLAADSAVAVIDNSEHETHGTSVWNHAKKLSHVGEYNIGTLSFGLGQIGQRNIQSLMYEFEVDKKCGCSGNTPVKVSKVAQELYKFLRVHYNAQYDNSKNRPPLGMIIAGYSKGSFEPEQYRFLIPHTASPVKIDFPNKVGIFFDGLPDAIYRLLNGIDYSLALALSEIDLNASQLDQLAQALNNMSRGPSTESIDEFVRICNGGPDLVTKLISWMNLMRFDAIRPGMPLQDGIDLAVWLIESTIGRYRFAHAYPFAGGPIDIAVITHAQYTWIQRKSWHGYEKRPI